MGLFSFVKSIGEKLTGGAHVSPESLAAHVKELGLPVQQFLSTVADHNVEIFGLVPDVATKEKLILAVGNLHGVEKVTEHIQVAVPAAAIPAVTPASIADALSALAAANVAAAPEPTSKFHTVEAGDTLSKIAREEYGNANLYNEIFEANKPMLKSVDKIFPGQILRIPPHVA